VFQIMEAAGIACLVGAGDTLTGLLVMIGVAIVNIPLAWGLCLGVPPVLPQMGFTGIATGTALSHVLGCTAVLGVLLRGRAGLRLDFRQMWPNGDLLRRLLRVSIPAGADSLSLVAGNFGFSASSIAWGMWPAARMASLWDGRRSAISQAAPSEPLP
jgi:Na+-driven multidrug efflux pump